MTKASKPLFFLGVVAAVVLSVIVFRGRGLDPQRSLQYQPRTIREPAPAKTVAVEPEPANKIPAPEPVESPTNTESTNRLSRETSPYLRMHANNPVDWYPWGEEAFVRARKTNMPIFLSVGYAACHWCGVMERESFSDPAIGELMNRHFVSVKLDREERPDVDRVYLTFLQLTTGGSGYPMSIFLTPDLRPILGGTYFPKESKDGLPSFRGVLTDFASVWDKDRDNVIKAANDVTESIRGYVRDQIAANAKPDETAFNLTYERLRSQYDKLNGGFGDKPKYPQPVNFNFLLRHYARAGQREALNMTLHSLRKIADGGIRDHIGGGFYRYSTDARWQVPHFEKMLSDQAQLAVSYLDAYQITRESWYAGMAREILDYVLRELKSPEGGFYSAQSADSLLDTGKPGVGEGAFYLWEAAALESELGREAAAIFNFYYGVESGGNIPAAQDIQGELKGRNVLFVRHSVRETAAHFQKPDQEIERLLTAARKKLLSARGRRPKPPRDDKIVTAGNGLMISALSRAAQILNEPRYANAAATSAALLKSKLYDSKQNRLRRTYRAGQAAVDGFLDDYAFLIQGLLDLYETSFDVQWLSWAVRLQDKQDEIFWDSSQGTYFATTNTDPSVIFRMRDEYDAAEPSANSVAAMNLLRLSQVTGSADGKSKAEKTFAAFSARVKRSPDALPQLMAAFDFGQSKPKQIIIAGKPGATDTKAMLRLVHERYIPNKVVILADGSAGQRLITRWLPFVEFITPREGKATAYICENYICKLPTPDLKIMSRLLDGQEP